MAGRVGSRKPVPRQSSSFRTVAVVMLIPICGLVVFLLYAFIRQHLGDRFPPQTPKHDEARIIAKPSAAKQKPEAAKKHGEIVLILDDVGFDKQPLAAAMRIDPNLNFSVLPNAQHADAFARELHRSGFEVMCHLPMEPLGYPKQSPGPNAVMTAMSDAEIERTTRDDIAAVPYAAGVNNHMGSRATSDARVMRDVLSSLPPGMFFIDSMTVGNSVAGKVAREMKIPTASRQVFLDDVQSEAAVRTQLAQLTAAAEERGVAVGIGHMYPVTIRVLAADAPALRARGFRFVRASEAVE
jgi:polysaccharide deacetylase 2 family uncharacterized protein YibQ